MIQRSEHLATLVLLFVVAAVHLSLAPSIASVDSFYHMGHAAHYAAHGIWDTSFPWATQSIIGDLGGDLWWGFHVVLVPFTLLGGVATQIRVASVVFTLILAGVVVWVLRRHAVPGAAWWATLFLVAVPNVLYRFVMVRPHVLSLALALVLLSVMIRGRWWMVLLAATGITWLHLSLFWMAPGMVVAYALARAATPRDSDDPGVSALKAVGAVLAGTLLGALLRPHPIATGELAYVQIVRLFAEKAADQPLVFAGELLPLPPLELVQSAWSFLLVWIAAGVAAWIWRRRALAASERLLLVCSYLIGGAFLVLAIFSARRALVEWTVFGFLALPVVWALLTPDSVRRRATPILGLLLAVHLVWGGQRHLLNARFVSFPANLMEEVATFLKAEATPADTVFHARWDNFAPLFAYDRDQRYLGGMDPIFQFAHDPGLYWEQFFLSTDLIQEYTCDAYPCSDGRDTDTWTAIRQHFGARWVLVEPLRNPKFTMYLVKDPRFTLALETQHEALFRVLESIPPSPPTEPQP